MLRLLIDENIDHRILRGVKSRLPELDFVVAREVGLAGFEDSLLLRWAAQNDRTIVTHDIQTLVPLAKQLVQRSEPMAGVIVVPQTMRLGRAIEDLELVIACRSQSELRDTIEYLPL